jgi:hypothetical protein
MLNSSERRIINSCQTCRTPIYEGEPIYTSSKGQNSGHASGAYGGRNFGHYQTGGYGGHYSSTHAAESWVQCSWCYDQWQAEVAANKNFWIKWWLGGILFLIVATIISIIAFPGLEKSENKKVAWHRIKLFSLGNRQIPVIAPIVLVVGLLLVSAFGNLFQPAVNRYKLRKRPVKKL